MLGCFKPPVIVSVSISIETDTTTGELEQPFLQCIMYSNMTLMHDSIFPSHVLVAVIYSAHNYAVIGTNNFNGPSAHQEHDYYYCHDFIKVIYIIDTHGTNTGL